VTEYDNELSGVLFKNDKEGNEKRPDYTGKVQVEGTEYRLAAWVKESNSTGNKFLSLKLSLPQEQAVAAGVSDDSTEFDF
jgi:uncharacterized protein (DUF736 family)